jgi:hypothetical protein
MLTREYSPRRGDGEYEEVTTGSDDRWPYAGWDFPHFALFYRGVSEYAREVCTFCARG